MTELVSIIIPVYNLEKYIENCLKSIINQTYSNIEIICVDDGSSDNSAVKIKSLQQNDDRIRYIFQENQGVSVARNTGLSSATGEYVMFVDGDDCIHNQCIEILYDCCNKHKCDMACSRQTFVDSQNIEMEKIEEYKHYIATNDLLFKSNDEHIIAKSACSKLIKIELARMSEFPVGIANGEDGFYVIMLIDKNPKIEIVDEVLYYYYKRENSAVSSKFDKTKFTITTNFDTICDYLKNSENAFLRSYSLQYLYQTIFYNRTMAIGTKDEEYILNECKRIGKKWLKSFKNDIGISLKIKIMFVVFYYSRRIYELARMITDPTMKDFYKSRKGD